MARDINYYLSILGVSEQELNKKIDEDMSVLFYRCWRYNFMEIENLRSIKASLLTKFSLYTIKDINVFITRRLKLLIRKHYEPMKIR